MRFLNTLFRFFAAKTTLEPNFVLSIHPSNLNYLTKMLAYEKYTLENIKCPICEWGNINAILIKLIINYRPINK